MRFGKYKDQLTYKHTARPTDRLALGFVEKLRFQTPGIFSSGQLSLERDFGYVGRRRLRRKGFSVKDINRLFLVSLKKFNASQVDNKLL